MGAEAAMLAEGVKFLVMLVFQEARKAGLSEEQLAELYLEEKKKFEANDPAKIPDPT